LAVELVNGSEIFGMKIIPLVQLFSFLATVYSHAEEQVICRVPETLARTSILDRQTQFEIVSLNSNHAEVLISGSPDETLNGYRIFVKNEPLPVGASFDFRLYFGNYHLTLPNGKGLWIGVLVTTQGMTVDPSAISRFSLRRGDLVFAQFSLTNDMIPAHFVPDPSYFVQGIRGNPGANERLICE
jgi:hypothetical protein